ncbi:hypothetical protein HanPSC8_Chr03g0107471 [Helianthus annuus]|nr:hypothetical protein HanPSC8_Chr03g0107471 [Helianthus annuus]
MCSKHEIGSNARNPGRQVDTPEVIPAEKVCFKGMDEFPPDGDQACCHEPTRVLKLPH